MELVNEGNDVVLPKGQPKIDNPVEFEKLVEKTKLDLKEETANQVKRPRGRPRKNPLPGSSMSTSGGAHADPNASVQVPANFDVKPVIKDFLKMPFSIVAQKTHMPELELTDAEAESPVICLNELINLYLPDLSKQDPKKVVAWSFALAMGMLISQKYSIYSIKINEIQKIQQMAPKSDIVAPPESPVPPVVVPAEVNGPVDAGDYFTRQRVIQ